MRRFMTGKEKALLEDADAHRPPTPDPFEGEGSIWIQVTLRTLSGDVLETTAFRSHESDDRALGSLVAMGKTFENEGCDYCYHLLLDEGKSINCSEKRYQKILDLAEADYFHVVPVEEAKGGKYKRDDIVFHLDLQQIAMERRTDMGAGATGPW